MRDIAWARPVIPLLIALICGIFLGARMPGYGVWAFVIAVSSSGSMFYGIFRRQGYRPHLLAPLIFFAVLGYLSIQPWIVPRFPANHVVHYVDAHKWEITGVIDNDPTHHNRRQRFILRTQTLNHGEVAHSVTGKLRVTVYGQSREMSRGDRIFFPGYLRSFRNFKNPGGFDYRRYMAFKGIWGSTATQGDKIVILKRAERLTFKRFMDNCRDRISLLIDKTPEGEHRTVLKALIIGQRRQISPLLREAFNRAGVGHLLAISGLHIGIVGTAAFVAFSWLLARFRILLWQAWTRKGAALLSFLPILAYAMIAGMSPSTQRALIMVAVFLMAFFFERDQDLMNTLAVAAMAILVINPPALFSISFQLSFVSVLSIIYGLSWVQRIGLFLTDPPKLSVYYAVFKKFGIFFFVSVFAIFGTLPLVMLYFNQISLVGILANFVIVPLIGFIVVPLGLLAVFILPLSMQAATWCIQASAAFLIQGIHGVKFFSSLPFAALKTITPSLLEIGCYYTLAWSLLNLKTQPSPLAYLRAVDSPSEKKIYRNIEKVKRIMLNAGLKKLPRNLGRFIEERTAGSTSRAIIAKWVAVLVILVVIGDISYWYYQRFGRSDLRVTVIDVGQGTAVLMELPKGYSVLVDGGGFTDNSVFDVGARVIAPLLWRKKILSVDTLILSHPNSDHINGLIYIARYFNVKNVWTNNEFRNTRGFREFVQVIAERKITLSNFQKMPRTREISGVRFKILYPARNFLKKRKTEVWRTTNNNSLVTQAIFGSISFLFPGDIMAKAEKELVANAGHKLKSTVLLAPHHGSLSSSTEPFLENVQPEIIVISAGWQNPFNFPHPMVLSRYAALGCRVFRTDVQGAIIFSTDGKTLESTPFIRSDHPYSL
jgi:competence protein ComEC